MTATLMEEGTITETFRIFGRSGSTYAGNSGGENFCLVSAPVSVWIGAIEVQATLHGVRQMIAAANRTAARISHKNSISLTFYGGDVPGCFAVIDNPAQDTIADLIAAGVGAYDTYGAPAPVNTLYDAVNAKEVTL